MVNTVINPMPGMTGNPLFDMLLRPHPAIGGFPEKLTTQQQTGGDTNGDSTGFEVTDTANPDAYTLSYTTDDHQSGTGCIKVLNTYEGSNSFSLYPEYRSSDLYFPVTANGTYTLSGYVKSDVTGANDCRARITWYTSAKETISNTDGTLTNSPTSWTQKTSSGTAPSNAAYAKILITATKTENHYMLYDTLSFKRTA